MEQFDKLKTAALGGNLPKVTKLLEGFDLVGDFSRSTSQCTRSMKAKRAKLNVMTKNMEYNLLATAIDNKHQQIVEFLLMQERNFGLEYEVNDYHNKVKNYYEMPLLQRAVETGDKALVELLLKSGASVNEKVYKPQKFSFRNGPTALHRATFNKYEEIVSLLLDFGANVHETDTENVKPMHLAAMAGSLPMVKLLFKHDSTTADCFLNEYYRTKLPLHYAVGHKDVFLFLLDCPYRNWIEASKYALYLACIRGCIEIVNILLDRGVDVNSNDIQPSSPGCTALQTAVKFNRDKVVKLLLDRGADLHAKNNHEQDALWHASYSNYCYPSGAETLKILLHHGANPNQSYYGGLHFPLHLASSSRDDKQELVETLLLYNADLCVKNNETKTPLQSAVRIGYFNNARMLIKWTVKKYFNCEDVSNEHFSAISSYPDMVTYWNDCKSELQTIKEEMISNTTVKYSDIMDDQSLGQMASYAGNRNILEALNSENLDLKFPIYGAFLKRAIEKGVTRRVLQDKARRVFSRFQDKNDELLPALPVTFIDGVFRCLSNEDLANLIG